MVHRSEQVATATKGILHEAVDREKPLRVRGGFKPAHLALTLARRLMRDLRSVVLVLVACCVRRTASQYGAPQNSCVACP